MIETQCPQCRLWRGHHAPDCPAAPTPPLPHAAADTAAVAGVVAPYRNASDYDGGDWVERLVGPDGWECELGEPEDRTWGRDGSPVIAELNRLAAERDRLSAELAAVRGAMPDPALLDYAAGQLSVASMNVHIASSTADQYRDTEGVLARAAARIRALATATPTPTDAGAGAGGDEAPVWAHGIDVTGVYWVLMHRNFDPELRFLHRGLVDGIITPALIGPRLNPAPPGWREALAALDTPQEVTDE